MSNRGSGEEFCAFIDAGSSSTPRGVDWFDSLWDDEDEDDDEMDNEAAEEIALRIHDDPYYVDKPGDPRGPRRDDHLRVDASGGRQIRCAPRS